MTQENIDAAANSERDESPVDIALRRYGLEPGLKPGQVNPLNQSSLVRILLERWEQGVVMKPFKFLAVIS